MKIGILLSGCGLGDGSQIEEVMLTYLALDKYGVDYIAFVTNKMQYDVINHYTEKVQSEERNILVEAARIGRGRIKDIKDVKSEEIDAIILPGGLGVFKNLSTFNVDKSEFKVAEDVNKLVKDLYSDGKPICGMCSSIIIIAKSLYNIATDLRIATGNNAFIDLMKDLNAKVENCSAEEIVIDRENKVITTPAFLASQNMNEIKSGIDKMVRELKHL